jgi:Fic family protein
MDSFIKSLKEIPINVSWYLSDLGESKGKQFLYMNQSPQKLKMLREHAIIESAVSSNRIEGVMIDQKRIGTVIFGKSLLRDRNEEEIRGYRQCLERIHTQKNAISFSEETIKNFHTQIRGEIWDTGHYKEKDSDIIEKFPDGRQRVRFKTVSAMQTPDYMQQLVLKWNQAREENIIHPLILLAAFNLDFLCIHPFRDGNGRVSRLLLLLGLYHSGYEVGHYISLERLIEENKERYYETLELSSIHWHQGKNDPWPYINYLLFIIKTAYKEFENRVEDLNSQRGSKSERVIKTIESIGSSFRVSDIRNKCPDISIDLIRKIVKELRKQGKISSSGKGREAFWKKNYDQ